MSAARSLVTTMKLGDQYKALLPVILLNLKPTLVQDRPEIERDYDAMTAMIADTYTPFYNEMLEGAASVYAANFTTDEMRQMEAFYRLPVGQKLLERSQGIVQQTTQRGRTSASAECGHWSGRAVRWSSCAILLRSGGCTAGLRRHLDGHTAICPTRMRQVSKPPSGQKGEQNRARDGSENGEISACQACRCSGADRRHGAPDEEDDMRRQRCGRGAPGRSVPWRRGDAS